MYSPVALRTLTRLCNQSSGFLSSCNTEALPIVQQLPRSCPSLWRLPLCFPSLRVSTEWTHAVWIFVPGLFVPSELSSCTSKCWDWHFCSQSLLGSFAADVNGPQSELLLEASARLSPASASAIYISRASTVTALDLHFVCFTSSLDKLATWCVASWPIENTICP